eukprot:Awhi_evm1s1487
MKVKGKSQKEDESDLSFDSELTTSSVKRWTGSIGYNHSLEGNSEEDIKLFINHWLCDLVTQMYFPCEDERMVSLANVNDSQQHSKIFWSFLLETGKVSG